MARWGLVVGLSIGLLAACGGNDFEDTSPGQTAGAAGEAGASGGSAGVGGQSTNCPAGKADCDGNSGNGCEVTLGTADNCGACGEACTGDTTCKDNVCQMQCGAGKGDCDSNAATGCEADLTTDEANCGGCKKACPAVANATVACESGTCAFECKTGFADCDKNAVNGCEADQKKDPLHCGGCAPCPTPPHTTPVCSDGTCGFECAAGWENCDADDANGCEAELATDTEHCGACGNLCADTNGTPSCVAGKCQFACNKGFGDCDGLGNNGCETGLSDPKNCGQCGHDCKVSACKANLLCEPVLVGTGGGPSLSFTQQGNKVFWHLDHPGAGHVIDALDKAGGSIVNLSTAALPQLADTISATSQGVFFMAKSDASLGKLPLAGGAPITLSTPPSGSGSGGLLATTDTLAFWFATGTQQRLFRAPQSGAAPVLVWSGTANPSGLAADDTRAYWLDITDGTIHSIQHTGSGLQTLFTGGVQPYALAADSTTLYFIDHGTKIVAVPKAGGAQTKLAELQCPYLSHLTIDASHVWFVQSEGVIGRMPKSGSVVQVIAEGQTNVTGIASDGEYVFWIRTVGTLGSEVYKVAAGQ